MTRTEVWFVCPECGDEVLAMILRTEDETEAICECGCKYRVKKPSIEKVVVLH